MLTAVNTRTPGPNGARKATRWFAVQKDYSLNKDKNGCELTERNTPDMPEKMAWPSCRIQRGEKRLAVPVSGQAGLVDKLEAFA
jgi:hypothetical protein